MLGVYHFLYLKNLAAQTFIANVSPDKLEQYD